MKQKKKLTEMKETFILKITTRAISVYPPQHSIQMKNFSFVSCRVLRGGGGYSMQ